MYKRRNTRGDGAQHEVTLAFTCQCGCDFPKAQPMHHARGSKQSDTPIKYRFLYDASNKINCLRVGRWSHRKCAFELL